MGAQQIHPNHKPKVQKRTVYFRESTVVEVRERPGNPPERRFEAVPVDFPGCSGFGFTQEGATLEAERKIREFMGGRFREVSEDG